ncbi:ParB/RepB/Spo0J family partition protein [Bradyrhizobium acaciae]|uniref:ParB/RepB/Spo0J family partition protein n=1 Tax=Bradyrhizobium acaciae TaxID=2683706 RepID=UPI001E3C1A2E|nr:ParB/RepB/Spo0J family partition protein [Bradyrhizobium acaciae]
MTKKNNTKTITIPASGTVLDIPLNKLKKSPRNVRKVPHPAADIEALAASIAANGMLQSPVVEPEIKDGKPTGSYLVTIGEGRRLAQLLRAKRKEIAKDAPVRCVIDTEHNATEISLAENAIRTPMHPADQFEAFFDLHTKEGMNADDIAARFGVTPAVVRQRLKLAVISPVLMQAYREEQLDLEQLSAFAFTDDHALQERVWDELGGDCERDDILELVKGEHVAATDPRARFVGVEAYQAAGGAISRDLFDDEHEGFFTDAALLQRLARDKLEAGAEAVRAEGWKWVEIMPEFDYAAVSDMRRVYPEAPEVSEEVQQQIDALEAQYDNLDSEDEDSYPEFDRIEGEIAALRGEDAFYPADIARGGAILSIGEEGELSIQRGFLRPEDDTKSTRTVAKTKSEGPAPIPESLVAELTAYQTAALRNAFAQHSAIALRAVVHALTEQAFFHIGQTSCLRISLREVYPHAQAKAIAATPAELEVQARHEGWAKRLPEEANTLWEFLGTLSLAEQIDLLAHCASLALDTIQLPKQRRRHNGDAVAAAIGFDMAAAWEPTPENYLGRVSKERILEAVREGASVEAADNIAGLKKQAMAEAAATRLRGKGWLPSVLKPREVPLQEAAE